MNTGVEEVEKNVLNKEGKSNKDKSLL